MYRFSSIDDAKAAVKCDTLSKNTKFCKLCRQADIQWVTGHEIMPDDDIWQYYKENTCYSIRDNRLSFSELSFYESKGYKIIDFDEITPILDNFLEIIPTSDANSKSNELTSSQEELLNMILNNITQRINEGLQRAENNADNLDDITYYDSAKYISCEQLKESIKSILRNKTWNRNSFNSI